MLQGRLMPDRWRLCFQSGDVVEEVPWDRVIVRCDRETGGRICFFDRARPDVQIFAADESILSHWALVQSNHIRPQLSSLLGRREMSSRMKLTAYVLLGCCLLVWGGWYAFGAIVRGVVNEMPYEWERKFGDEQLKQLSEEIHLIDDSNRVARLAELAAPLVRVLPERNRLLTFHIMEMPEPNAAALPGGHVLVTTGLLDMVDRPEQLLGVISHELAHVTRRHGLQRAISGAGPVLIMQILLSDRNNRLNVMAKVSGLLIYQSFSQSYEREADMVGWDYLVAANIDPRGLVEMLEKFKAMSVLNFGPQAFSSHPALPRRIRALEEKWDKLDRRTGFLEMTNSMAGIVGDTSNAEERKAIRIRLHR
jgi:Zn-dependent protease with chaperone function